MTTFWIAFTGGMCGAFLVAVTVMLAAVYFKGGGEDE